MRLDEEDISKLDRLSQIFLRKAREVLSGIAYREEVTDRLRIVLPARSPAIGDLEIYLDGDEITVYLGQHTHCHFSLYMVEGASVTDSEEKVSLQAADFLRDLLADRIVIWSQRVDGRIRSGGSHYLGAKQTLKPPGAESFLWSGRRMGSDGAA